MEPFYAIYRKNPLSWSIWKGQQEEKQQRTGRGNRKERQQEGQVKRERCFSTLLMWSAVHASAPPSARSSHQISSHGSSLYVFGGESGPHRSHFGYGEPVGSAVHTLDMDVGGDTAVWTELMITAGVPPSPRLGHGQCVVGSYLYVFGGRQPADVDAMYDGSEEIRSLNDLHRLELTTGVWEELPGTGTIPSERSYHGMTSHGSTIFVFGGMVNNDRYSDLYALSGGTTWSRLPDGPMEGRGGAGLVAGPGPMASNPTASLWVVAGFSGRPVGDVWEFALRTEKWVAHPEMQLTVPRSIFACCLDETAGRILVFGGELSAALGDEEAGKYSSESLSIALGGGAVTFPTTGVPPTARGWTSGCIVESKRAFVVFGGIRQGCQDEGEPAGVRLGDVVVLAI
jgi:hypothetical protein